WARGRIGGCSRRDRSEPRRTGSAVGGIRAAGARRRIPGDPTEPDGDRDGGRVGSPAPPGRSARPQGPRVSDAKRTASRILVVEDDPDNRRIVVRVLTTEGYETLEAADGRSAMTCAR